MLVFDVKARLIFFYVISTSCNVKPNGYTHVYLYIRSVQWPRQKPANCTSEIYWGAPERDESSEVGAAQDTSPACYHNNTMRKRISIVLDCRISTYVIKMCLCWLEDKTHNKKYTQ